MICERPRYQIHTMNSKQWQAIEWARQELELGERASVVEIKQAYHRLSKLHHPDHGRTSSSDVNSERMYRITAAYESLMRYCNEYRFPLQREEAESGSLDIYDPEDWWQARFGQDPLWGSPKKRRA
jgi:hypothetical protein